jgi:hypothetical protein
MNALKINETNEMYKLKDSKRLSKHVVVNYLEPYVGPVYSENNVVVFVNDKDGGGCVTGDLVTWTKNYVGEEYLSEYNGEKHVKVKFPKDADVNRGDAFECLTKSPFIVNDKIKFTIDIYNKTGEGEVDMSNYDPKAIELIETSKQ